MRARHTKLLHCLRHRGNFVGSRAPACFPVLSEGSCRRRIGALRGRRSVLSTRSEGPQSRASRAEPHHPDRAVAGCREPRPIRGSAILKGIAKTLGFGANSGGDTTLIRKEAVMTDSQKASVTITDPVMVIHDG